jgi:hypothetical protein
MMKLAKSGRVVLPPPEPGSAPRPPPPKRPPKPVKIVWDVPAQFEILDEAAVQQAAEEAKKARTREALRTWRFVALAVAAVAALIFFSELAAATTNALPPAARLQARSAEIAEQVRRLYDSPRQPLALEGVKPVLFAQEGSRRATYDVVVTLRLRVPLYAPANSNGAQTYLQLQRSLADARARVLRHGLDQDNPALRTAVEMPLLLAVTHKAGEPLVIKVPLEAERSGWTWKFGPPRLDQRNVSRQLTGNMIRHYQPAPFLVFGTPAGREQMRQKITEARRYIQAANTELARRGLSVRAVP